MSSSRTEHTLKSMNLELISIWQNAYQNDFYCVTTPDLVEELVQHNAQLQTLTDVDSINRVLAAASDKSFLRFYVYGEVAAQLLLSLLEADANLQLLIIYNQKNYPAEVNFHRNAKEKAVGILAKDSNGIYPRAVGYLVLDCASELLSDFPSNSAMYISQFTTLNNIKAMQKFRKVVVVGHSDYLSEVKEKNIALNKLLTKKAMQLLQGKKNSFYICTTSPPSDVLSELESNSHLFIGTESNTLVFREILSGKNQLISIRTDKPAVLTMLPNNSNILMDKYINREMLRIFKGKNHFFYFGYSLWLTELVPKNKWVEENCKDLINPFPTILDELENNSNIIIDKLTSKKIFEKLQESGKNHCFYIYAPDREIVDALKNNAKIVVNRFTSKQALQALQILQANGSQFDITCQDGVVIQSLKLSNLPTATLNSAFDLNTDVPQPTPRTRKYSNPNHSVSFMQPLNNVIPPLYMPNNSSALLTAPYLTVSYAPPSHEPFHIASLRNPQLSGAPLPSRQPLPIKINLKTPSNNTNSNSNNITTTTPIIPTVPVPQAAPTSHALGLIPTYAGNSIFSNRGTEPGNSIPVDSAFSAKRKREAISGEIMVKEEPEHSKPKDSGEPPTKMPRLV